jgi:TetR/AcrR family transcriptional repressor of nem operon
MPRLVTLDHEAALDLALELFWQRGYREVSIDDLVHDTGLNRHALYSHYRNKHGLAVVVLQRYCAEATRRLQDVLHGAGSPRGRLEQLLHLREPDCADPFWRSMLKRGCLAARMVAEMRDAHPEVAGIAAQTVTQLLDDVTAVVREGQAAGEFRCDLDAELLAMTVVSGWMAALVMPEAQRKGVALAALN